MGSTSSAWAAVVRPSSEGAAVVRPWLAAVALYTHTATARNMLATGKVRCRNFKPKPVLE
jgi:hypothetical protein